MASHLCKRQMVIDYHNHDEIESIKCENHNRSRSAILHAEALKLVEAS